MSVQVIDNFSYKGKKGNFERDNFDTLQAMRSYPEDGIDDGHVCFCNEDGNHYKFNHLNSVDGATGRWRLHNKSVNTLTETGEGKVLDARQGKILKDLIDAKVIEAGGVSFDTVPTKDSINPVTSNGIKEAMDEQAESINSNTGVADYPVFSASEAYSQGKVVNYNGKLYKFTADHAAGAWIGTDVEETDVVKAHIVQELGNSEDKVVNQKAITENINAILDKFGEKILSEQDSHTDISHTFSTTFRFSENLKAGRILALRITVPDVNNFGYYSVHLALENNTYTNTIERAFPDRVYFLKVADENVSKVIIEKPQQLLTRNESLTVDAYYVTDEIEALIDNNINLLEDKLHIDSLYSKDLIYRTNNPSSSSGSFPIPISSLEDKDAIYFLWKSSKEDTTATVRICQRDSSNSDISSFQTVNIKEKNIIQLQDECTNLLVNYNGADTVDETLYFKICSIPGIAKSIGELDNSLNEIDSKMQKDVQSLQGKINAIQDEINAIQAGNDTNFIGETDTAYKFGQKVTFDNALGKRTFKLYGSINSITAVSENKAYIANSEEKVTNGVSVSVTDNIIHINGTCNAAINNFSQFYFELEAGRYAIMATVDGNASGLTVMMGKTGQTANIKNVVVAKEYDTVTSERIYCTCQNGSVIDCTIKLMVKELSDEEEVPETLVWSEPSDKQKIDFTVKDSLNILVDDSSLALPVTQHPLNVIPVFSADPTELLDNFATYSNGVGDCYVADSYEYSNGALIYVQRVGHKIYNSQSDGAIAEKAYITDNINGLIDGCNVWYELDTPITTDIELSVTLNGCRTLSTDNDGTYFYVTFDIIKKIVNDPFSVVKMGKIASGNKYTSDAAAIKGTLLFVGGQSGYLSKIDISQENNMKVLKTITISAKNWIRGICYDDTYLYVISRDPASGTTVTEDMSIGNLTVIDIDTFSEQKTVILKNKGTGGMIYGDNIYVMEQMWDWAIYSLEDLRTKSAGEIKPVFQLDLDSIAGYSIQWQLGEYQNIAFFENGNKTYCAISAFDKGVNFFDITEPSNTIRIGGCLPYFEELPSNPSMQIFDVTANFPYLYCTIAPGSKDVRYSKEAYRGIVTVDISNMDKFKVLHDEDNPQSYQWGMLQYFPKGTYQICDLPYKEWSLHMHEGDLHPSRIRRIGDCLITNNGDKGIALYRIVNNYPQFYMCVNFAKGCETNCIAACEDGKFAIATCYGDSSLPVHLFRAGNVDYD